MLLLLAMLLLLLPLPQAQAAQQQPIRPNETRPSARAFARSSWPQLPRPLQRWPQPLGHSSYDVSDARECALADKGFLKKGRGRGRGVLDKLGCFFRNITTSSTFFKDDYAEHMAEQYFFCFL